MNNKIIHNDINLAERVFGNLMEKLRAKQSEKRVHYNTMTPLKFQKNYLKK